MIFCPKCKAILVPKRIANKSVLVCGCGYLAKEQGGVIIREKINLKKEIEVIDKEVETLPKTEEVCPKCGNKEAYYWLVQTRAADEGETRFFRCVKCKHTWRKY